MIAWGLARHYHTTDESTICHPVHCMHKKEDMLMKAKYLTLLVSFVLGAVQLAFGQNSATVLGTIRDATTDEPVFSANIIVKGESIGTTSGKDGRFVLEVKQTTPVYHLCIAHRL